MSLKMLRMVRRVQPVHRSPSDINNTEFGFVDSPSIVESLYTKCIKSKIAKSKTPMQSAINSIDKNDWIMRACELKDSRVERMCST